MKITQGLTGDIHFFNEINDLDHIPAGYYRPAFPPMGGPGFLEKIEMTVDVPDKIYGTLIEMRDFLYQAFERAEKSLAVLLDGAPGTGKTLVSKMLIKDPKVPVIILDYAINDATLELLQQITEPHIVFIDEAEKIYSGMKLIGHTETKTEKGAAQEHTLLRYMDGVVNCPRLILMTTNDSKVFSSYFENRPSRIRYHYQFNNLALKTVKEIILDKIPAIGEDKLNKLLERSFFIGGYSMDILLEVLAEVSNYPDHSVDDIFNRMYIKEKGTSYKTVLELSNLIYEGQTYLKSSSITVMDGNTRECVTDPACAKVADFELRSTRNRAYQAQFELNINLNECNKEYIDGSIQYSHPKGLWKYRLTPGEPEIQYVF